MKSPLVSVCMPVYNSAGFLAEAIESILKQSFTDFELLIMDDCSTDNSREIISRYASQDSRIVAVFNTDNLGMVNNWNACLVSARGEYVKFLFGDDLLASQVTMERMVAVLAEESSVSLVATARNIINAHSAVVKVVSSFPDGVVRPGTVIINRCLSTQKNLVGEPSVVMFRNRQASRGFDARYNQLVDLEMWFHLLEQGDFAYIAAPLSSFRNHDEQQTKKNVRNLVHVDEMLALMADYGDKPYCNLGRLTKEFLRYHQFSRIWKAYKNGTMTREKALARIGRYCPPAKFMALTPLYKLLNPLWKLQRFIDSCTNK